MRTETLSDQAQLNRRWRPALMAFFLRRVRNHAEAEDLTQEVFLRLLGSGETVTRSPDSYVFQMAANLLRDRARRLQVRGDYREGMQYIEREAVETIDPYRLAAGRAELVAFAASLEDLPERTRTIFTLYRLEQLSLDAIAETYGISKSAVKKHVTKAMAFLMRRLRDVR